MYNVLITTGYSDLTEKSLKLARDLYSGVRGVYYLLLSTRSGRIASKDFIKKFPSARVIFFPEGNLAKLADFIRLQVIEKKIDTVITEPQNGHEGSGKPANELIEQLLPDIECPSIIMSKSFYKLRDIGILFNNFNSNELTQFKTLSKLVSGLKAKLHLIYISNQSSSVESHKIIKQLEKIADNYNIDKYSINVIHNQNKIDGMNFIIWKKNLDMISLLNAEELNLNNDVLLQEILIKGDTTIYYHK